ncbi:MAG: Histidine kinase [Nitrosarchaeum sp.]|nr:Histidine kinase [Nitrosarchaeum sp.]
MNKLESKKNPAQNNRRSLIFLMLILVGLTLIYQLRLFFDDSQFMWISVTAYSVIPGILVVLSIILTIKLHKQKHFQSKALLFFTLGASFRFIAEQIWQVYDHVYDVDPFPSIADIFYVGTYPFFIAFLFISLAPIRKSISKKIWLFSIILSTIFLIPSILISIDNLEGESSFSTAIALAYPIMSAIQLTPAIVGIMFLAKKGANFSWMLLLFGFLFIGVSDTFFLFTEIDDSYYDGHPVDLMFLYAFVSLIFSLKSRLNLTKNPKDHDQGMIFYENIRFETINKFGIPLLVIIISLTVITFLISTIYFTSETKLSVENILIGVAILLGVFVAIVFTINKNLTRLVEMRTKELEKQRDNLETLVEQKSQELVKSERFSAIGELSGRLAHDLRNPLSVMKMSIELIKQSPADVKIGDTIITKRLDLIEKSIDRISHQVDDVLDYVRDSPLNLTLISLRSAILNSITKIEIPQDVKIIVADSDLYVNCDLVKMDAVFINLIINSIQAMDQGGIIEIKITPDGNDAVVDFIDSGSGIAEELMEKIFEPLFTTKQKGTGLGLASCKNIINQHGGNFLVKNNPTTFTIRLPMIPEKQYAKLTQN